MSDDHDPRGATARLEVGAHSRHGRTDDGLVSGRKIGPVRVGQDAAGEFGLEVGEAVDKHRTVLVGELDRHLDSRRVGEQVHSVLEQGRAIAESHRLVVIARDDDHRNAERMEPHEKRLKRRD
ncbi:unannotated protein [freshwater metagenome]|uniref:Unannotated protein n=1 Tax=freshwater metagenome TaxID=449393 RepID=A0A6J7PY78_9ZZZZ